MVRKQFLKAHKNYKLPKPSDLQAFYGSKLLRNFRSIYHRLDLLELLIRIPKGKKELSANFVFTVFSNVN